ncbi:SCO family protein [Pseudomonas lalucatii]|uniref:SCO family protein n=1 Tax=Pseudomonas lalucatii TaxID=1424203 RepID=A0ABS5PXS4_9PSED|nr:SCO family protein [Pseudomonas lalucatii]MBS7660674.1 SCO family protein [Pseudomonas lalucatii]MBS7724518.1 SCO family protein [Pseudomonas lalucatii]QVM87486.1 SCO family protein [Pseudomonas lalucatii]
MNTRRKVLAGMGAVALGGLLWQRFPAEADSDILDTVEAPEPTYFPNVWVRTHEGERVRFYDDLVRGKIVTVNMMYVDCSGACPTMTSNLRRVQELLGERLGRDVFMYSITLQPLLDRPQQLREYVRQQRLLPGWKFLTGAPDDIERLRYGLGFYDPDPEVDRNLATHTGMLRVGNDRNERWTMAPALADPERIITTINHVDGAMVHTVYKGHQDSSRVG